VLLQVCLPVEVTGLSSDLINAFFTSTDSLIII